MSELSEFTPKVLISHSWQDKMQAVQIADSLRLLNCANVWIDFEQMGAGDSISSSIRENLSDANYMVLVWTTNSVSNKNVQDEIKWAKEFNVHVIPCFFEYDENNNGLPKIPAELELHDVIHVDFRNINSGSLTLFDQFTRGYKSSLPKEILEEYNPKFDLIKKVNIANSYLINFNKVKGNPEHRVFWIKRIMPIIEDLAKYESNKELVQLLMQNLDSLKDTDPQAYDVVLPYISKLKPNSPVMKKFTIPEEIKNISSNHQIEQIRQMYLKMVDRENNENLTYSIAKPYYPSYTDDELHQFIQAILNNIAETIIILLKANKKVVKLNKTDSFKPIFNFLTDYFFQVDDVRSDSMGALGWMDDCYLCLSSLNKLNENYKNETKELLVNIPLEDSIKVFKNFLKEEEVVKLDKMVEDKFNTIDWKTILIGVAILAIGVIFVSLFFGGTGNDNIEEAGSNNIYIEDNMAKTAAEIGFSGNFNQSPIYN